MPGRLSVARTACAPKVGARGRGSPARGTNAHFLLHLWGTTVIKGGGYIPSMLRSVAFLQVSALALVIASCARRPEARVTIAQPRDGDTLTTAEVRVVLEAQGIEIVPATEKRPGTGHHHLFLDTDVTPLGEKIPQGVTGIIHLGRAQSDFTFTDVAPGSHRLIAVVADADHVPIQPPVVDTIHFVTQR